MFLAEDDAVPTIRRTVEVGSTIYADESASWDALHAWFDAKKINRSIAFARLRCAEIGQHHCISRHLGQYASEMAWREDNRRNPNETLYSTPPRGAPAACKAAVGRAMAEPAA